MKLKAREYASKYLFITHFREDPNEIIRILILNLKTIKFNFLV
jgi:hypothetical protein